MSASKYFLCWDCVLLGNPCQTATYIANGLAHEKWGFPAAFNPTTGHCFDEGPCACVVLTDDDDEPITYTSPDTPILDDDDTTVLGYEACWYDPNNPCSAEYLGAIVCERAISQSFGRDVTHGEYGASIGKAYRGGIEVTFTLWLVAGSFEGGEFGHQFIARVLGNDPSACGGCPDSTMSYLDNCGECPPDDGVRTLNRVALVSQVEDVTPDGFDRCMGKWIQFTAVSESPWVFGTAIDYWTDQMFPDGCGEFYCAPDCATVGDGPCGEHCVEITEPVTYRTTRARTECNLLVYPDGQTCPEVAADDYSECLWIPVPTPFETETEVDTGSITIEDEDACVECPVRLVGDNLGNLTWEPLPGFEWHTPGEEIDYDRCCPVVLEVCVPNLGGVNPFACATANDIDLDVDNVIIWPAPAGGDGFLIIDPNPDQQVWQDVTGFMDCLGLGYPTDDTDTFDPETGNGERRIAGIFINPESGCWEFGVRVVVFEEFATISQTTEFGFEEIPGSCFPLTYETVDCQAAPSGPVCCNITLNADRSVTPDMEITDPAEALQGDQCTFEVVCPEDSAAGGETVLPVVCPKVVHATLNDPADPYSDLTIVSPEGDVAINEIDTVIIDNLNEGVIEVLTTIDRTTIECGNPCVTSFRPVKRSEIKNQCWCAPVFVLRECTMIDELCQESRVVSWSVTADDQPIENLRIRFWVAPPGMPLYEDAPDEWECRATCATIEIPYIAPGATLSYDAPMDRSTYSCNGVDSSGDQWFNGDGGGVAVQPAIPPGMAMMVCAEANGLATGTEASVSLSTHTVRAVLPSAA